MKYVFVILDLKFTAKNRSHEICSQLERLVMKSYVIEFDDNEKSALLSSDLFLAVLTKIIHLGGFFLPTGNEIKVIVVIW